MSFREDIRMDEAAEEAKYVSKEEEDQEAYEHDMNGPATIGVCQWCGGSILETDDYTEGDDGSGWMHVNCT